MLLLKCVVGCLTATAPYLASRHKAMLASSEMFGDARSADDGQVLVGGHVGVEDALDVAVAEVVLVVLVALAIG